MVSPLLQQSGWMATYTRFLFLAFLEAYHSQAFSSGDAYVMSFSKGVLRALSAICQQDGVARAWALKLGIVRTLIQEIDLEQSVNDIRERQLKKSRDSSSAAAAAVAAAAAALSSSTTTPAANSSAHSGPRQRLLHQLSDASTETDDDEDDSSELAKTQQDFLAPPTAVSGGNKQGASSSHPPLCGDGVAVDVPSLTATVIPPPIFSHTGSGGSGVYFNSPLGISLPEPSSDDSLMTRHVSEILGSPLSMHTTASTNNNSLKDPLSSGAGDNMQFPHVLSSPLRPRIAIPKLSLASAPPPLYYTSNGDTGATVEATMTNMSFVKSGSFAFPVGSGASFAGVPVEHHVIDDQSSAESEAAYERNSEGEAADIIQDVVEPEPQRPVSPPQREYVPPPGRPPLSVPKLSLASAPPPLYYTSNGDTGATVEATMSNMSFVKSGSFAFASFAEEKRVQAQLSAAEVDDDTSSDDEVPVDPAGHHPLPYIRGVIIEPCTEDDSDEDDMIDSRRPHNAMAQTFNEVEQPCAPLAVATHSLPTPILVSGGGGGSGRAGDREDSAASQEQSLSMIDASGVQQSVGGHRLDGVRPARITMPFPVSPPPGGFTDAAGDSSSAQYYSASGATQHSIDSEGSTSSVGLSAAGPPLRLIAADGAFSTATGVVYIPPLAMTMAALRGASTPHAVGRSPSARASRTVRLVEPGDGVDQHGSDDAGAAEFDLPQRSVREGSPDARIPGSTRTSASPRLGLSNPRVGYAHDTTCDDEVHAATGMGLHRSNSVLSRRSELCSPTESAAAGVYPLQLVLNEAKFAAHQRAIRRIYRNRDIQIELLYLILNLVIGPNGMLEPMYASTFTVRGGHRVQVLFHLHMHLNHDANARAVQGLWNRLVGESGANSDRSSTRVNHSTLPPPRWYHQRSSSLHDRGMKLLFQMTCFRTNLATTYERQDKIGVGGYGAVMSAVISLDPHATATSSSGGSSIRSPQQHLQQQVMSPASCTSSASTSHQRDFPTGSVGVAPTDAVTLLSATTEGGAGFRNERVAVKIAPVPHHIDDRETLVSFFNEVLLLTHLQDIPEVVRLLDCGCDGTQYLVVMPLYHGSARDWRLRQGPRGALPPLAARVAAIPPSNSNSHVSATTTAAASGSSSGQHERAQPVTASSNPFAQCLGLFSTLLRTMCHVHRRRIVHHDLKLDNVFLDVDESGDGDDDDGVDARTGETEALAFTRRRCRIKLGDWGEGEVLPVIGKVTQPVRQQQHQQQPQPQHSTVSPQPLAGYSAANSRKTSTAGGADVLGNTTGDMWSLENSITPQHDLPGTPIPFFAASVPLAGNSLTGYEQIAAATANFSARQNVNNTSANQLSMNQSSSFNGGSAPAGKRPHQGQHGATLFQTLKQLYLKPKGTECIRAPEALLPHKYLPSSLSTTDAHVALLGTSSSTASSVFVPPPHQHHHRSHVPSVHHHERTNMSTFADDVALIVQKGDVWAMGCLLYELLTGDVLFGDQEFGQVMHRMTHPDPSVLISPEQQVALSTWGATGATQDETNAATLDVDAAAEAKKVGTAIESYLRVLLERDPVRRPTMHQALEMWEELLCQMRWDVEEPAVFVQRQQVKWTSGVHIGEASAQPTAPSAVVSPRDHGSRTPAGGGGGPNKSTSRRSFKLLQESAVLGASMAQFAATSAAKHRTMPWLLIIEPSAILAALESCSSHRHGAGTSLGPATSTSARSRSISALHSYDGSASSPPHAADEEHHRTAALYHVAPSLTIAANRSAYGLCGGGLGACDNSYHQHHPRDPSEGLLQAASPRSEEDATLMQCYSWGVTHMFSFYHIPNAANHFHYQHCQKTVEAMARECGALDQLYLHSVRAQQPSLHQHHLQQPQRPVSAFVESQMLCEPSGSRASFINNIDSGALEASVSMDTQYFVGGTGPGVSGNVASTLLSGPAGVVPPSLLQHQLMSRSTSNHSLMGATHVGVNMFASASGQQQQQQQYSVNSLNSATSGDRSAWAVSASEQLSPDAITTLLQSVPPSVRELSYLLCHRLPAQYQDALMKRGRLLIPSFLVEDVDYAVVATLLVVSVTYRLPILTALFHVRQNCHLDPNRVNLLRTLQTAKMLLAISTLPTPPPSPPPLPQAAHPPSWASRLDAVVLAAQRHQRRYKTIRVDDSISLASVTPPLLVRGCLAQRREHEGAPPRDSDELHAAEPLALSSPVYQEHSNVRSNQAAHEWCRCVCGLCTYVVPTPVPSMSLEHVPVQQIAHQRIATAIKRSTEPSVASHNKAKAASPPAALSRSGTPVISQMAAAAASAASLLGSHHVAPDPDQMRCSTSFLVPHLFRQALHGSVKFFYVRLMAVYGSHVAHSLFTPPSASPRSSSSIPVSAEFRVSAVHGVVASSGPQGLVKQLNEGSFNWSTTPSVPSVVLPAVLLPGVLKESHTEQQRAPFVPHRRQHMTDPLHDGTSSSDLTSPITNATASSSPTPPQPQPPVWNTGCWEGAKVGPPDMGLMEIRCVRCRTPTHYAFCPPQQRQLPQQPPSAQGGGMVVLTWVDFPLRLLAADEDDAATAVRSTTVGASAEAAVAGATNKLDIPGDGDFRPLSIASSTRETPVPFDNQNRRATDAPVTPGLRTRSISPATTATATTAISTTPQHHRGALEGGCGRGAARRVQRTKQLEQSMNDRAHAIWMGRHHLQ